MSVTVRKPARDSYDFARIHPDAEIAREVVIDYLLGALCEAECALSAVYDLALATPNGLRIKHNLIRARIKAAEALAWRGPGVLRFSSDALLAPATGGEGA